MRDLATELRDYVDSFDEPFDPGTLIEKADRVMVHPPQPRPSFRRGIVIGFAAALIVLVLVGGVLLVGGPFGGDQTPVVTQPNPQTTVTQPVPATTVPTSPSTTMLTTIPPAPSNEISFERNAGPEGNTIAGLRGEDLLFRVNFNRDGFFIGDAETTREPDGTLSSSGWEVTVWDSAEIIPGSETSPGRYRQTEIHRLWPTDSYIDVLWLTDYSGATRDTLTGYTPDEAETFTVFDEIVLQGEDLGLFALHPNCATGDGQISAALLSFESGTPIPVIAWTIDYETMTFVELADPSTVTLGDCYTPAPRPPSDSASRDNVPFAAAMTEVREGSRMLLGSACNDPVGDVVGNPSGGDLAREAADLVDVSVQLTDTEVVITYRFETSTGINEGAASLIPLQENYSVWLVTPEGQVFATLESFHSGEWLYIAGIHDEDVSFHSHPDWISGVTETVEGDRMVQRWSREKLETQLGGEYTLENLEWFVTTGGGMGGPEWFDRCPDTP
jgi:hypothetical protein